MRVRLNAEMEPVRIFDDWYRSKLVRPDRTGRSIGLTSRLATDRSIGNDRSTGDLPV
jgi:hypothetical protein